MHEKHNYWLLLIGLTISLNYLKKEITRVSNQKDKCKINMLPSPHNWLCFTLKMSLVRVSSYKI